MPRMHCRARVHMHPSYGGHDLEVEEAEVDPITLDDFTRDRPYCWIEPCHHAFLLTEHGGIMAHIRDYQALLCPLCRTPIDCIKDRTGHIIWKKGLILDVRAPLHPDQLPFDPWPPPPPPRRPRRKMILCSIS